MSMRNDPAWPLGDTYNLATEAGGWLVGRETVQMAGLLGRGTEGLGLQVATALHHDWAAL